VARGSESFGKFDSVHARPKGGAGVGLLTPELGKHNVGLGAGVLLIRLLFFFVEARDYVRAPVLVKQMV